MKEKIGVDLSKEKIRQEITKKWEDAGYLKGLKGHTKDNIAALYCCQASFLINDTQEDPSILPIAKRVINQMMDNEPIGDLKTDLSEGL